MRASGTVVVVSSMGKFSNSPPSVSISTSDKADLAIGFNRIGINPHRYHLESASSNRRVEASGSHQLHALIQRNPLGGILYS